MSPTSGMGLLSGMRSVSRHGFVSGDSLWLRALALALGTRFGFGHTVRLWASYLDVQESIANAGMRYSCGIVQLSGKPGEKQKHCKVSVKKAGSPEAGRCLFSFG